MKKRGANLNSETLYEMGDAVKVQKAQLASVECEKDDIGREIDCLRDINTETQRLADETEACINAFVKKVEKYGSCKCGDFSVDSLTSGFNEDKVRRNEQMIRRAEVVATGNNWEDYKESFYNYAQKNSLDIGKDPFSTALSQREYENLVKETNDDFAKKTSIRNKTDLMFLTIAIALQVTKSLLFPLFSEKRGYGERIDKDSRLTENDKTIIQDERHARNEFRDRKLSEGHKQGEWSEILYRTPPYDTTKGSPAVGVNMEGKYHRIHTLGHDPILGWVVGTVNILTDTITFDNFVTYNVERKPMIITQERVPFSSVFFRAARKIKENPLNLPAALLAEKIHLKSDEFTKCGLPIPILETLTPEFAGKLYKNQYDALCFSRDLKIVGTSAVISTLIDMIIGLVHGLYYDKEKDGTKDMFEVRTRKILLVSNMMASTSNIIYSIITQNPKHLDIGGLLVTMIHIFSDTRFLVALKREFLEKRIYEKIEKEIDDIKENENKLLDFEYRYILG